MSTNGRARRAHSRRNALSAGKSGGSAENSTASMRGRISPQLDRHRRSGAPRPAGFAARQSPRASPSPERNAAISANNRSISSSSSGTKRFAINPNTRLHQTRFSENPTLDRRILPAQQPRSETFVWPRDRRRFERPADRRIVRASWSKTAGRVPAADSCPGSDSPSQRRPAAAASRTKRSSGHGSLTGREVVERQNRRALRHHVVDDRHFRRVRFRDRPQDRQRATFHPPPRPAGWRGLFRSPEDVAAIRIRD